jgi:hypothetical protein
MEHLLEELKAIKPSMERLPDEDFRETLSRRGKTIDRLLNLLPTLIERLEELEAKELQLKLLSQ